MVNEAQWSACLMPVDAIAAKWTVDYVYGLPACAWLRRILVLVNTVHVPTVR